MCWACRQGNSGCPGLGAGDSGPKLRLPAATVGLTPLQKLAPAVPEFGVSQCSLWLVSSFLGSGETGLLFPQDLDGGVAGCWALWGRVSPRSFLPTISSSSLGTWHSSWCPARSCLAQSRRCEAVVLLTDHPALWEPWPGHSASCVHGMQQPVGQRSVSMTGSGSVSDLPQPSLTAGPGSSLPIPHLALSPLIFGTPWMGWS